MVRSVQETEALWLCQGDPNSPRLPWMPFQAAEFLSIVFECVPEMTGSRFLDVGCGPGTKMSLARHFYGLTADGIEVNEKMAAQVPPPGNVWVMDALDFDEYWAYDLIWLYRPFRHADLEEQLEKKIRAQMKPGAILAGGAWQICPGDLGWATVVDDWELQRGAWMKPPRRVSDLPSL